MDGVSAAELLRQYGAIGLFAPLFIYLLKHILDTNKADIESRVQLATALNGLTEMIRNGARGKD